MNNKITLKKLYWTALVFVTGFLVASSYSNAILVGLTSYSFSEIFALPMLFLARKQITFGLANIPRQGIAALFLGAFLCLLFVGLGLANDPFGSLRGVVGASRAYIYILITAVYFKYNPLRSLDYLFVFCLGALIGDALSIYSSRQEVYYISGLTIDMHKANLIALFLGLSIPIIKRHFTLTIIASFLVAVTTIFSGFRINILIVLIALVASFLVAIIRPGTARRFIVFIGAFVSAGVGAYVFVVITNANVLSNYSAFRLIDRTTALLKGDVYASQDIGRLAIVKRFFSNLGDYVFPRGFASKHFGGLFNDAPFIEIFHVFSLFGGLILIVGLCWFLAKKSYIVIRKVESVSECQLIAPGFFLMFMALLSLNGRFLYIPFEALLFGVCLGLALSNSQVQPDFRRQHASGVRHFR